MDISFWKYIKLLAFAAFLLYAYIEIQKSKNIKAIKSQNLTDKEKRELRKWDSDDWQLLIIGTLFGAPMIDGIIYFLSSTFK